MTKKILILFSFLLLLTGCKQAKSPKDSYQKVDITAYYHYNNQPLEGIHVEVFNYETAYRKIKSGKFNKNDLTHYTLDGVRKKYQVKDNEIIIENYHFGKGIQNSSQDAKAIIRLLFENCKDYLTYMNGLKSEVVLSNPDNSRYKFSNSQGKLVGTVESGLSMIRDTTGAKNYKLTQLKKNSVVYIGNTRPIKEKIRLNNKKVIDFISADYGQELTYKIPVTSNEMTIKLSPNFVVDSVNYPYSTQVQPVAKKVSDNGELVETSDSPVISNGKIVYHSKRMQLDSFDKEIMNRELSLSLSKLYSLNQLTFEFKEDKPKYLLVKGHVSSKVTYTIPLILELANDQSQSMDYKLDVYSTQTSQGIYVYDKDGGILTPQIESYGINFVTFDGQSNKPKSDQTFLLAKFKKGKVSVLEQGNANAKWHDTYMSIEEFSKHKDKFSPVIIKGNQYNYSDGKSRELPLNYDLWKFDEQKQKEENQPLFKLRGLSKNYKYFLLPLNSDNRIVNKGKPITFTVGPDSIANAKNDNYEVNGFISDMQYDKEEYQAISVVTKNQKIQNPNNPLIKAAAIVGLVLLSYLAIIFLFVKKL